MPIKQGVFIISKGVYIVGAYFLTLKVRESITMLPLRILRSRYNK